MKKKLNFRWYQKKCLDKIHLLTSGAYLISMCCGAGKTFTFSKIEPKGRVLILAHRKELLKQAASYYDCPVGFEQGKQRSNGEPVVVASVASIVRRLENFEPGDFDIIIYDECHHASAKSNKKIVDYFKPRLLLGFTATPNRADGQGLDEIFDEIIFEYSIEQAIREGHLADIECKRVTLDFNLNDIKKSGGDYNANELSERMAGTEHGIAQAYREHARNKTIIFGVDIEHCKRIAAAIPGSKYLHGGSHEKEREQVLEDFMHGDLNCLINCMLFTEGTDMPMIETVIWARPTQSESLYIQGVCRGARLFPGKEKMLLIDCVDASGKNSLCSAPTLIGVDIEHLDKKTQDSVEGDLFGIPDIVAVQSDTPEQWIQNVKFFDLWKRKKKYKTHGVNYFKYPDGRMRVSIKKKQWLQLDAVDSLNKTVVRSSGGYESSRMNIQRAFDFVYKELQTNKKENDIIWHLPKAKKCWGKDKATDKQMNIIRSRYPGMKHLTKMQAAQILTRIL